MASAVLTTSGLVLDIIGVVMLFRYGLPEDVRRKGQSYFLLEATDHDEIAKAARYDKLAYLALTLIVAGFVMQIIGSWIGVC